MRISRYSRLPPYGLAEDRTWRALDIFALAWTAALYSTTIFHAHFDRTVASAFLVVYLGVFTFSSIGAVVAAAHALAMLAIVRLWGADPAAYLLATLALGGSGSGAVGEARVAIAAGGGACVLLGRVRHLAAAPRSCSHS